MTERLQNEPELLYSPRMKLLLCFVLLFALLPAVASAQNATSDAPDYSGMYSFLKDGEFVQITIEDKGAVSGFISRYGDSESDKGKFLDQFFKSGKLDGKNLSFTTEVVHGVSYSFEGAFDRGPGKKLEDEGYFVLKGTLTRDSKAADGTDTTQSRQVEFKSFPRDVDAPK